MIRFSHFFKRVLIDDGDQDAVDRAKTCGAEFRQSVKFFIEITRKITSAGISTSLAGLIQSIDFDDFYGQEAESEKVAGKSRNISESNISQASSTS